MNLRSLSREQWPLLQETFHSFALLHLYWTLLGCTEHPGSPGWPEGGQVGSESMAGLGCEGCLGFCRGPGRGVGAGSPRRDGSTQPA